MPIVALTANVMKAEVVVVIGANPTVNHPVAATWIKNAVKNGTKLIVMDPRRSDLARLAHRFLQFKADTDVALLNAMMNVIVTEGLANEDFIAQRTVDYAALRGDPRAVQVGEVVAEPEAAEEPRVHRRGDDDGNGERRASVGRSIRHRGR